MFNLKFERVYMASRQTEDPSTDIRAKAERQTELLHPERVHVLSTCDGRTFSRLPLVGSAGWYVTYTPAASQTDKPVPE